MCHVFKGLYKASSKIPFCVYELNQSKITIFIFISPCMLVPIFTYFVTLLVSSVHLVNTSSFFFLHFIENVLLAFWIETGIYLPGRMIPSYFCWSQLMASSLLILFGPSAACPVLCLRCWNLAYPAPRKVQAVDTDARVTLDPQVDVFLDCKAKVSSLWEVIFSRLVLSHL